MDAQPKGKLYRIPLDQFHLFCLPNSQALIDRFNDNDKFSMEELGFDFFSKRFLQSERFRKSILEAIEEKRQEDDHARRCYPSVREVQVYQYMRDPNVYFMGPRYEPARELAQEWGMPLEDDVVYVSTAHQGTGFKESKDKASRKYKKYTVEYFGLIMKSESAEPHLRTAETDMPPPGRYASEPTYLILDSIALMQVWRRRVFRCTLKDLALDLENPLSPFAPEIPYVEERWWPAKEPHLVLGSLEEASSRFSDMDQFVSHSLAITGRGAKKGRRLNSGYFPNREMFLASAREAYKEVMDLGDGRPGQKAVAIQMFISPSCFKKYRARHKVIWPDDLI
jgi:hypothetical protein